MKSKIFSLVKFFLGWPLSLLAIFFIIHLVQQQTSHISFTSFHPNAFLVVLAILSFVAYFLLRSIFWQQVLKAEGHLFSLKQTAYLWGISEFQRYIPGNIWSFLGRTFSFNKLGVEKKLVAKLWLFEAEFVAFSGAILSLLSINFIIFGILPFFPNKHLLVNAVSIVTGGISVLFLASKLLVSKIKFIRHLLPTFSMTTNLWLMILMLSAFFCFGLGTYFSFISFIPLYLKDFNTFIGFFNFAFLIGYLTIIFPMGLGPREGIMIVGVSRFISIGSAAIGTFFSRIMLIVGELVFLIIVFIWKHFPEKKFAKIITFLQNHKYFLITLLLMTTYVLYFTTASMYRYNNYYAGRFDLGNMDQTVWNTIHGRIFQLTDPDGTNVISRLSVHADFILVLLAPFYLLWQDPRMLLFIQTIVLAAGAIFVYLLAKDILKQKYFGLLFAGMYLLSPVVEYTNLYDFHGVTLATTFFLGAFYFLRKQKTLLFFLLLFLAGSTKEEAWVVVALFGLYTFFIEKRKVLGSSLFIIGSALFYFIFFKAIPLVRGGQHFAVTFYSDFGNSPANILKTIFLSPLKTLGTIIQKDKILYLVALLFPLGFLSLLSPLILIFLLPDLAVNLLSSNPPYHQIYYQYTAVLTPFLFIAALFGLKKLIVRYPLVPHNVYILSLVITCLLAAYAYGPLPIAQLPNVTMFTNTQPDAVIIDDFLSSIPRSYSIAATNNIGSHLSHRQLIYTIPIGIDKADILVFLLNDQYAQPSLPAQIAMTKKLETDKNYVEVIHKGDFVAFEKTSVYPHKRLIPRPNSLVPFIIEKLQHSTAIKST